MVHRYVLKFRRNFKHLTCFDVKKFRVFWQFGGLELKGGHVPFDLPLLESKKEVPVENKMWFDVRFTSSILNDVNGIKDTPNHISEATLIQTVISLQRW